MNNSENFYTAIGKRKCAVAKVFLKEGTGTIMVNGKSFEDFFSGATDERDMVKSPFLLVNLNNKYDIAVSIHGGGITAQLEAIRLAISKALCQIDNSYRQILNVSLFLRRDSRIKERRKYGLKKARKASQYSKR
jgi:small subunit ribosomal protein S9|tara:strand:+ start:1314 stop:1715 length:402 start_codon:yes stop_codon:yes gene_type:complete